MYYTDFDRNFFYLLLSKKSFLYYYFIVVKYTFIVNKEKNKLKTYSHLDLFNDSIPKADEDVHRGRHVLAEFFECDPNTLNSIDKVEKYMMEAALECGATIVQKCFHMFSPYGVSGVVIISESHLAIHTWPELGYAAADLFTCGSKCDPKVAYEFLKNKFCSKNASFTELKRGIISPDAMKVAEKPFEIMQQFQN